jgi:hypothetical protein
VVHELVLHRCTYVVRELALHRDEHEVGVNRNHHDGHDLALHLYMYVVRESVLSHHGVREVHELELRRCTYEVHELALHRDGSGLALHHHGVHAEHGLGLHLYMYVVRGLDDHLRNDCVLREFQLAFRHPCVVVCPKDSKHHCCAWRHELQHVEILLCYVHLDRVVREVHGIRLLPPWILALRASWQQLFLLQRGEAIRLLAWIRYRGRGLVLAFGRAAFS